jgi:hypothetical protein
VDVSLPNHCRDTPKDEITPCPVLLAGVESSEELSHIHLDSDACLIAVEKPCPAGDQPGAVGEGVALVLAFRGTEPLELSDFQSDFDAVPEAGEPYATI